MVILASPNTVGHSPKVGLVVTMTELGLVEPADQVEQQLATSLGERQIAELVEDDEVEATKMIGGAALAAGSRLGVELVSQIDAIEEAATRTARGPHAILIAWGGAANAGTGDADSQVRFARAGAADQHQIASTGQEATASEVAHQGFPEWIMGSACW